MPALDSSSLGKSALNEFLHDARPALVGTATDVVSAVELLIGIDNSDTVTAKVKPGGPGYLQHWASATRDPWLVETMDTILVFRHVRDGWDGEEAIAPTRDQLRAAEMLASFLAQVPERVRPSLSVDASGRPTYAANTDKFYLHMTVDSASTITWFAEAAGKEYYENDVKFDGRFLPSSLDELFATAIA